MRTLAPGPGCRAACGDDAWSADESTPPYAPGTNCCVGAARGENVSASVGGEEPGESSSGDISGDWPGELAGENTRYTTVATVNGDVRADLRKRTYET